jgi:hypothetical protein
VALTRLQAGSVAGAGLLCLVVLLVLATREDEHPPAPTTSIDAGQKVLDAAVVEVSVISDASVHDATAVDARIRVAVARDAAPKQQDMLPLDRFSATNEESGPPTSSLAEVFQKSPPAPQHETALRPLVKKVFRDRPFQLECRGWICRIAQPPGSVPEADWSNEIQSHADGLGRFTAMEIHAGSEIVVFAQVAKNPANRLLVQVITAITDRKSDVEDCKRQHPTDVSIGFRIRLDTTRHLTVDVLDGRGSPRAQCLDELFRRVVAPLDVPVDAHDMPAWTFLVTAGSG